jgi:protein TonB
MRRDLIIGLLVSILVHGGLGISGSLFNAAKVKKKVAKDDTPTITISLPPIEPDDPEPTVEGEASDAVATIAPPSLADVPGVVQVDSFVQQVQPPPPPNMGKPTGAITIPTGRPAAGVGKGLGEIFDISKLDQAPQARFQPKPAYPFEMRRQGITGEVVVEFVVDSNGDVRDPYAKRSSQREFETAAVQAVQKWKFKPGKKGGKNVNTRMLVPIEFSISADE